MKVTKKLVISILLLLVLAAPLFGSCSRGAVPEKQKGEITVGILDDFSGPVASECLPKKDGYEDCIKYINEDSGGILGHQVRAIAIDHKMDSSLIISGWNRLRDEHADLVVSVTAAVAPVMDEMAQRDHIPLVGGAGTLDQLFPKEPSFYFADNPHLPGIVESAFKVMDEDWHQRGSTRQPRIGFDVVSLGTMPIMYSKAAKMSAQKRGWEIVITRTSMAAMDVTTQVLQMKEFKIDYFFSVNVGQPMILWVKELNRQNLHPTMLGISFMGTEEMWNAVGQLAVGAISRQSSPVWDDTDIPLIKLIHELNAKWYPNVTFRPVHYCQAFTDFTVEAEAIKRAIQKTGYENRSGESMREAMETIREFEPMGIGIGYTWTPTDHQGLPGTRWYIWTKDGKLIPKTGWDIFDPLPKEQQTDAWWMKD